MTQKVDYHGNSLKTMETSSFIFPQGSVLGPLLFVLYINELPSLVSSNLLMFADDIKLYRCIRSPEDCLILQNAQEKLTVSSDTASQTNHRPP